MNILSAIYSGQTGFLRASQAMNAKAERISQFNAEPGSSADEDLAKDIVGMKIDEAAAKANLNTVKVADGILNEFVKKAVGSK